MRKYQRSFIDIRLAVVIATVGTVCVIISVL
jgi:hypothetical protein